MIMKPDSKKPSESLQKLREITNSLPDLTQAVLRQEGNEVEYAATGGTARGWGIYASEAVAVQREFLTVNTMRAEHIHSVKEILICYRGCVTISFRNRASVILMPGAVIVIEPGEAHELQTLEDSWLIGLLVPCNGGYPDALKGGHADAT